MYLHKTRCERWMRLLVLLTVFMIAAGVSSCVAIVDAIVEVSQRTISLKVMTYNIFHSDSDLPDWKKWVNRRSQVLQHINMIHPDVIGVQEARKGQINYLIENLPDYDWYGVGRDDGDEEGEYAAIFYLKDRFHISRREVDFGLLGTGMMDNKGTFWFSNNPDDEGSIPGESWGNPTHPRICSWVHFVETETNKMFYFYNLHLEHGSNGVEARNKSVRLLGERISSRRQTDLFVVVGDFNATSTSDAIEYIVDNLGYLDSYAETNENSDDGYTFGLWGGTMSRIDYIFTHPNAILTDSHVYNWGGSDHYPLVTTLLLPIPSE